MQRSTISPPPAPDAPWHGPHDEPTSAALDDASPVGLYRADAGGAYTDVNARWCELSGCSAEEARAGGWLRALHPDDRAHVLDAWAARLAAGRAFAEEYRFLRADGSVVWVLDQAVPRRDAAGVPLGYAGAVTDVTERRQTEETLRGSEARVRALATATASAIWTIDPSGDLLDAATARWPYLTDLPPEEVAAEWLAAVHPDDRAPGDAIWRAGVAAGRPFEFAQRVRQRDGSYRHYAVRAVPVRNAGGAVREWVGADIDVTERRRAEDALRASEERYRTLVERIDQGFCVIEMLYDADGHPVDYRFLEVNETFGRHTGLVDAVGKSARALVPGLEEHWFQTYGRVAETGEAYRFEQGSEAMGRWFEVEAVRVGGPASRTVAVLFADVSQRKRAEESLRDLNRRIERQAAGFDTTLSTITDYVYSFDAAGRFLYANQVLLDLWGLTKEEAVGKTMADLAYPAEVEARLLEGVRQVFATGQRVKNETFYTSPAGVGGYYENVLHPVVADDGSVAYVTGSSRDITTLKRRELNAAFLADLGADLARLTGAEAIMRAAAAKLGGYLALSRLDFAEFDAANDAVSVVHDWHDDDRASQVGAYRISDFIPGEVWRVLATGEQLTIADAETDARTAAGYAQIARFGTGAFVTTPYLSDGRCKAALSAHHRRPHAWRADELELLRDVADRVWPSIERARAEVALRESEERLRLATDAADMFAWETDLVAQTAKWSANAARVIGCAEDDLPGAVPDGLFIVHPGDRERIFAEFARLLAAGDEEFLFEFRGTDPGGERGAWSAQGLVVYDAGRRPVRVVGVTQNVTERRRAEERLRESERRLQVMANAMPQVVWVADPDGTVRYYNDRVAAFAGVTQTSDGAWDWQPMLHLDDLKPTLAAWEHARRERAPYAHEHRIRMADGAFRWHLSRAEPVLDPHGEVTAWYGTATDIHEFKEAEQEVQRRRREFESLAEHAPDIVVRFDRELRHRYVNPAAEAVSGIPVAAYLGKTNAELGMPADLVALWEERSREAFATGQEQFFEYAFTSRDGPRHFRARLVPEVSPDGAIETLLSVTYDVTERALAEAERQTLLDALAHDLKNPLAALKAQAQLMRRQIARTGVPDADSLSERIAGFEGLANRLTELVEELGDHARLAMGQPVALVPEPTDLVALVRDAVAEVRQTAGPHEIRFERDAEELIGVWDGRRLRRVAANLLSNAVKYSPGGGEILVRLGRDDATATLEVRDSGIGIPAADLDRVFAFRGRAGNVGTIAGSGIGLAGAKRIVEQHGGTIAVASTEGRGSTFTVRLPLASAPAAEPPA